MWFIHQSNIYYIQMLLLLLPIIAFHLGSKKMWKFVCLELLKKKKSGLFTTLYLPLRRSSKYWVNKNWTQLNSFNYFIIIITSLISRDLPVQWFFFFLVLTSFTGLVLLYSRSKPLHSDCKASLRVTRISFLSCSNEGRKNGTQSKGYLLYGHKRIWI